MGALSMDTGNTAWVLASSALVLLMTPGLALFYGGMVRPKNIVGVLMQNFTTMGIAGVLWVLAGFTVAFGPDVVGGLLGNLDFMGLRELSDVLPGYTDSLTQTIPPMAFVAFQAMFAIITPALFTGAIAERMRFGAFVVLVSAWSLVVYAPVAHWVFSPVGWLFESGAQDFAGGAVVHINAGAAAFALALMLGRRRDWPKAETPMHSVPLVLLGAGLLWFGWFGFNAGSALGANGLAATAFVNTNAAAAAAMLGWMFTERARSGRGGKTTSFAAASGLVAGLVAITPAAGYVTPMGALLIGALAGIASCYACSLKYKLGFDDALDVVGIHFFAGVLGAISIGFLGTSKVGGANGLLYGGGLDLLGNQVMAVVAVTLFSFAATAVLAKVIDLTMGLRVDELQEEAGLDVSLHGEVAYDFGYGASSLGGASSEDAIELDRISSHEAQRTGHRPTDDASR